jgi:hypothetical protein
LEPNHWQPASSCEKVQEQASGNPRRHQWNLQQMDHPQAADGLEDNCRCGEEPIRQHNMPIGNCDVGYIATPVSHPFVERTTKAGAKKEHHAQNM